MKRKEGEKLRIPIQRWPLYSMRRKLTYLLCGRGEGGVGRAEDGEGRRWQRRETEKERLRWIRCEDKMKKIRIYVAII